MKKTNLVIILVVLIIGGIVVLLFPVEQTCGYPGASCAYENPQVSGSPCYRYDRQPLGITIIEAILQRDSGIQYTSGTSCSE